MTQVPGSVSGFQTDYKIPIKRETPNMIPNMTSIVDMGCWQPPFDPNMCQPQPALIPVWSQQPYPYQGMMPQTLTSSTPTVISSPPVLNANGIKRKIDKDILSELNDPTLPKALTAMFQPLYCKLCTMHLNSSSNAKLHYQSKNHQKKVRKYLIEYSEKTGEPLHKRAKMSIKTNQIEPTDSYCEICDLQLTSKLHAEQHYMGKNHHKAKLKARPPAGSGYYDEEGKWHRIEKEKPVVDVTGRHGIGLAFAKPEEFVVAESKQKSKFYCDLCKVTTTSAEHLQMHISGQKHQKNLKKQGNAGLVTYPSDPFQELDAVPRNDIPKDNILTSVIKNEYEKKDYSVYRTPSGWYYCQPCNVTLNSESQFVQHLDSKKHLKKKNAQK